VARIRADHADNTFAADDLAVAADLLDGSRNSHLLSPKSIVQFEMPEQLRFACWSGTL